MLPKLRLILAVVSAAVMVTAVGLALFSRSPTTITVGLRSALGAPLEKSLPEPPDWRQFIARSAAHRAEELNRLLDLPNSDMVVAPSDAVPETVPTDPPSPADQPEVPEIVTAVTPPVEEAESSPAGEPPALPQSSEAPPAETPAVEAAASQAETNEPSVIAAIAPTSGQDEETKARVAEDTAPVAPLAALSSLPDPVIRDVVPVPRSRPVTRPNKTAKPTKARRPAPRAKLAHSQRATRPAAARPKPAPAPPPAPTVPLGYQTSHAP